MKGGGGVDRETDNFAFYWIVVKLVSLIEN